MRDLHVAIDKKSIGAMVFLFLRSHVLQMSMNERKKHAAMNNLSDAEKNYNLKYFIFLSLSFASDKLLNILIIANFMENLEIYGNLKFIGLLTQKLNIFKHLKFSNINRLICK